MTSAPMTDPQSLLGRETDRRGLFTGAWRRPPAPVVVRPPGALAGNEFEARCDGCGDCAEVCPADAIRMTGPATNMAATTPQIEAEVTPCVMCEGLVCASACPRGALKPVEPGEMHIALASRNANACWAEAGIDPGCDHCYQRCPIRGTAITWRAGQGPRINATACTGCGSCLWACPAQPKAISLTI